MARTRQSIARVAKIAETGALLALGEAQGPNFVSLPSTVISNTLSAPSFQLIALAPLQVRSTGHFMVNVSAVFEAAPDSTQYFNCGLLYGSAPFTATGGTDVDGVIIASVSGTPLTIGGGGPSPTDTFPGFGQFNFGEGTLDGTWTWGGLVIVPEGNPYLAVTISAESSTSTDITILRVSLSAVEQ
jgi:hypothetical protein